MYDTIVLKSPKIDIETKDKIINFCNMYEGIDYFTGELLYCFTRGELEGSYDYRIRISVDDSEWIKKDKIVPERVKTYWHMTVECSLHKLLMNHNCYGGPIHIKKAVNYLVSFLEDFMQVKLPDYNYWEVNQIDVAKIFIFNNPNICKKVISNLKNSYYTRRKPMIFDTSVMFFGSTTANKFYWKGPEFKKHDYKRINKYIRKQIDMCQVREENYDLIQQKLVALKLKYDKVLERANRTIRFECSIKNRKLKDIFSCEKVYVWMLNDEKLHNIMNNELHKIIKENDSMDIVRRSDLVLERLREKCKNKARLANALYSTWCQLVQFGHKSVLESMPKSTFYDHLKLLQEYGCSWTCSVVNLKPFSIVPDDFSFLNEKYVDNRVDPEVTAKLEKIA